jgi:hypothetical protein
MKINPPKAEIGDEDAFQNAFYERKEFGQALTSLLRNVSENLVILVNAPWGEGKTTFTKMWLAFLKQQKLDVIYFDAYAADHYEDPFISFSGEILKLVDKRLKKDEDSLQRRENFKKKAGEVGKSIAGLAVKIGLRAASFGIIESSHIKEFKDLASDIASDVSEAGASIIEKKIESYSAEKDSMEAFIKSLEELSKKVREEQDFPLTIIIDELDRCRPDFALGLLERIKHLFHAENVAFVLFVNLKQIESFVENVYGGKDGRSYILKFANIFVDLPNEQVRHSHVHEKGRADYCETLFYHYGFSNAKISEKVVFVEIIGVLANHLSLTLREIERVFTVLALYFSSAQIPDDILIPVLAVIKVKKPDLYQQLLKGDISADQFFKETTLDKIQSEYAQRISLDYIVDILKYCLTSDAEIEINTPESKKIKQFGQQRFHSFHFVRRLQLIPFFCGRLDRFSVRSS